MLIISKKALGLWVCLFIMILLWMPFARLDTYLCIYCVTVFICASWCVFCIRNRVINTLTVFSLFYAMLLGFGPVMLYSENVSRYAQIGTYIIVAYICFIIGFYFCGNVRIKRRRPQKVYPAEYNPKSVLKVALVVFCIGIAAYTIYFANNWHIIFGKDLENGRVAAMTGNGIFLWLGRLTWLAVFMVYEQKLINNSFRKISKIMIVVASVFSILLGFRSALVDAICILFFMGNKKSEIPIIKMLLIALALFTFVGLYGMVRSGQGTAVSSILAEFRVSSINLNYILANFPDRIPFQEGATYLFDFRTLFDDNVPGTTQWLKESLNLSFSGGGVTPTLIGEFYLNWGNIGVIIGMTAVGGVFKKIDRAYRNQNNSVFLSCLLLGYIRSIIRGGIGNCAVVLTVYILGYYCCLFVAKRIKV